MKFKTKRSTEKTLMKLVDEEVKEGKFKNREKAIKAIVNTTHRLFENYRKRERL